MDGQGGNISFAQKESGELVSVFRSITGIPADVYTKGHRILISHLENKKEYVSLAGSNDVNDPIFRGSCDYSLKVKKEKITELEVRCYLKC